LTAFVFAALIVVILVGGSFWIMYHLDHNMMPTAIG
jgi:heme/copper-type cytochrome/quinol oxidase subunit 4